MSPHIALLRAVNVGGRKVLKDDLLGLAKDLGFDDAKTLLASGNLVLWGKAGSDADIEKRLEDGLEKRMGLRTEFMVRSAAELKANGTVAIDLTANYGAARHRTGITR